MRLPACLVAALSVLLLSAQPATAAAPLGLTDCAPAQGVHQCSGLVATWDGVPLDTTVTLPRAGARGLPLIVLIHGFGNSKYEYLDPAETAYTGNAYVWARAGYAVLTYTARGFWGSCGTPEARIAGGSACAAGYIHLADHRYEVRDTQELIGRLVDEGVADRRRLAVSGDSYGGGQSLALAALSDRTMLPGGRLVPWRSPRGKRLKLAAAAPVIPWSDLIHAIAPNGRTLTYAIGPRATGSSPVGVQKASVSNAIFAAAQFATGPGQPLGEPFVPGRPMGFLAPPGVDPDADVTSWISRAGAGEPYDDALAAETVRQLRRFHSALFIDPSHRPPPLFLASGFTDDLFPVDETVRYANHSLDRYPRLPLSLFLGDFGHQRSANKARQRLHLLRAIRRWLDHYVRGRGRAPRSGVTAYAATCPRPAPSRRPVRARSFWGLARGELRARFRAPQTVASTGGDPSVAAAIDPVAGGGDGCVTTPSATAPGTAVYRLRPAARAQTLLGAPTLIAGLRVSGEAPENTQVAARLWDVAPGGRQTLVARSFYRPRQGRNVWQLHPAAWTFARGHIAKLELLGNDAPFGRPSNGDFEIEVRRLQLRLPVRRRPDCRRVLRIAAPLIPAGRRPAPGVRVAARGRRARECAARRGSRSSRAPSAGYPDRPSGSGRGASSGP